MEFSLIEKLAIVKTLDEIIVADGEIHEGELKFLNKLMKHLEFDKSFVKEAKRMRISHSIQILSSMSTWKKKKLAKMMHKMAIAKEDLDPSVTNSINSFCKEAGIDVINPVQSKAIFDLSYIYFESSNHNSYEKGVKDSRKNIIASTAIKIEPIIFKKDKYHISLFDTEEGFTIWGDKILMPPIEAIIDFNSEGIVKFISEKKDSPDVSLYYSGPEIKKILFQFKHISMDIEYLP